MNVHTIILLLLVITPVSVLGQDARVWSYTVQNMYEQAEAFKAVQKTPPSEANELIRVAIKAGEFKGYVAAILDNASYDDKTLKDCARFNTLNKIAYQSAQLITSMPFDRSQNAALHMHTMIRLVCESMTSSKVSKNQNLSPPATSTQARIDNPIILQLPLPLNGQLFPYTSLKPSIPFSVVTRDDERNFFVLLEDWNTGKHIIGIFVRGGKTVKVNVPNGSFRLKYATGINWYGEEDMFGKETSYHQADSQFEFSNRNGVIQGFSVELFLQENGNLETSLINKSDW